MTAEQVNWDTIPLRSLCLETTTVDPTRTPDKVFEYVDVSAISNDLWKIVSSTRHTGATAPGRARKLVRAQDVIFATVRPSLKRIALVPQNLDEQMVSTAFCVLRADPIKADPRFIYYSLLTEDFVNQVSNLERGASYPAVTDKDILEQKIVVPPLPNQRAIAAVLSKIQAAVELQEKIVATFKELKAATMAKLFREGLRGEPLKQTEIGEIPESWEVVPCEAICEMISVGIVVTPAKYYVPAGVPCFRSLNVQEDRLVEDNFVFISEGANDLHVKSKLHAGDVIIVRSGYPGTACVVPQKYEGANCIDLIIARPDRRRVLSDYLSRYINSPSGKRQIMFGQGGLAQQHFNVGAMKRFLVALPSGDEQLAISGAGVLLDGKITTAEIKLSSLKAVFSSMLHLLMTGQVRVTQKMIALQALEERKKRQKKYSGKADERKLQEIVQRIVEAVDPEQIVLFGSAARSEMGPDSDVDLLVVKACDHPREMQRLIYRKLIGVGIPKDIIVVTPQHLEKHKDTIGYIYRPALREGKVLYAK